MTRRTKKIGTAGRFGARYGVRVRKQIASIEAQRRKKHMCPRCLKRSVKREGTSIWRCRHCGLTFASGAYVPNLGRVRYED
ncbi:MAG: 50S ribosomal protein L37ae [Thermoplasmata archaeon]|nr:50S ribosomal protein L37ae [Thermoplasmata archaeon]